MKLIKSIADIIYPPKCVSCGCFTVKDAICPKCLDDVNLLCVDSFAPVSGFFHYLWALAAYEGPWMDVIHKFKYGRDRAANKVIFDLLKKNIGSFYYVDCVVPVPLHIRRYAKRGYNQSVIIAKMVSRLLERPVFRRAISKKINTAPQVGMGISDRKRNLKNAFAKPFLFAQSVKNKNVLLVDDVVTSGSTVNECSRILVKYGAKRVDVLTLAKTL